MGQERAFLSAISDDPDDDLHRLGVGRLARRPRRQRRADFIRAEVRLASLVPRRPRPRRAPGRGRRPAGGPRPSVGRPCGRAGPGVVVEPGLRRARDLVGGHAADSGRGAFPCRADPRASPADRIRRHRPAGRLPPSRAVETLDLGHTSPISHLRGAFHRDRSLQQLFVSPHLTKLKRVLLRGHGIEGPLIQTLIDTKLFARFTSWICRSTPRWATGRRASWPQTSNTLAALDLRATNVTAYGLRQLLRVALLAGDAPTGDRDAAAVRARAEPEVVRRGIGARRHSRLN